MIKEAKKKSKLIAITNMDILNLIDELFSVTDESFGINKNFKKKPPRGVLATYFSICIKKLATERGIEVPKTKRIGYNDEKVFDYLNSKKN